MKKQTVEVYCDVCGKKSDDVNTDPINDGKFEYDFSSEHSATVNFRFGYGSQYDTFHGEYHLCAIHAEELFKMMRERWPEMITDGDIDKNSYIGECAD